MCFKIVFVSLNHIAYKGFLLIHCYECVGGNRAIIISFLRFVSRKSK